MVLHGNDGDLNQGVVGALRELLVDFHGKGKGNLGENKGQPGGWKGHHRNARGIWAEAREQLGEEQGNVPATEFFQIHIFYFPT